MRDGLDDRCRSALRGYGAARLEEIDLDKAQLNRQGFKEFNLGLIFLALCLMASSSIDALRWQPDILRSFLVEGLVIVGWISLWHPVDLLLFSRWTLVRDQRALTYIEESPLSIQATPQALPRGGG